MKPKDTEDLHARILAALRHAAPAWLGTGVDDVAQAAWIKIFRQQRDPSDLARLRPAYLWRVVHSEVMDELRRRRRRGEVGLETVMNLPDSSGPDVERSTVGKQLGRTIRDCLGLLVENRRRVVSLYLVGHRVPEIAQLLGISRKQAENLVFRGIQDLRRHLRERGYEHGE